jgi:hypothetical protein
MWRGMRRMVVGFAVSLLVAACGTGVPPPAGPIFARYQFTCCTDADINQVWHPGETVMLHWHAESATPDGTNTPNDVLLTAVLSGPYGDVPALKKGGGVPYAVQGSVVRTNDRSATSPVTTFILPSDLPAGYYSLTIKVDRGRGNSMSAGSVVRVEPR